MSHAYWQLSRALNLSDTCRLSLPAENQPGAWAVSRVGYVNTISEAMVSGNQWRTEGGGVGWVGGFKPPPEIPKF